MNKLSSTANLAAVFAFLIGLLESGVIAGGLAWAFEDGLGGLEWAVLSLMGIGGMPAFVVLGLTAVPLLWLTGRFARTSWRVERDLSTLD